MTVTPASEPRRTDPVAPARRRLGQRARPAVHRAGRVRAAGRRHGVDVGVHRRARPPRRRGEGHPAGADAHRGRRLAGLRADRAADVLAPHAGRRAAAGRGHRAHLRLHRRRPPEWDGRWLLVLARAPESERPTRHLLRTRLTWAGLGSPAPGVWISPHADAARRGRAGAGRGRCRRRGAGVRRRAPRPRRPARRWCAQAWDLDGDRGAATRSSSTAFRRRRRRATPLDRDASSSCTPGAGFPWIDPALPGELLPTPWRGVDGGAAVRPAARSVVGAAARSAWAGAERTAAAGSAETCSSRCGTGRRRRWRTPRAGGGVRADAQQRQPLDDHADGRLLRRRADDRLRPRPPRPHDRPRRRRQRAARGAQLAAAGAAHAAGRRLPARRAGADDQLARTCTRTRSPGGPRW